MKLNEQGTDRNRELLPTGPHGYRVVRGSRPTSCGINPPPSSQVEPSEASPGKPCNFHCKVRASPTIRIISDAARAEIRHHAPCHPHCAYETGEGIPHANIIFSNNRAFKAPAGTARETPWRSRSRTSAGGWGGAARPD